MCSELWMEVVQVGGSRIYYFKSCQSGEIKGGKNFCFVGYICDNKFFFNGKGLMIFVSICYLI